MSPNLYDLLDVDPTATSDEIRAAWKAAIADLDPTDRRFRAYNDAAGVLLDDEKRAAYDAELAAAEAAEEAAQAEADAATAETESDQDEPSAATASADAPDDTTAAAGSAAEPTAPVATPAAVPSARGNPSMALMVTAAVVALLSVIALVWVLSQPGVNSEQSAQERADAAAEEKADVASAEEAAGQTLEQVLSYDYRSLDEGLAETTSLLTPEYADQHTSLIEQLRDEVVKQKTVVQAVVEGTAITRINGEGTIADVVVFVDQDVRKAKEEPVVLRMWVTATMVREGDEWLLDALCTEGDCA